MAIWNTSADESFHLRKLVSLPDCYLGRSGGAVDAITRFGAGLEFTTRFGDRRGETFITIGFHAGPRG